MDSASMMPLCQWGRKQYLVHWVGYDSDQNTWEPVKNLCGYEDMMKECEEKRNQDDTESESDVEEKPKPKKPARKPKPKAPARIKPSFYYVSSSEDEAGMLKDRFWKDLEDGKVDIFRTADLYSTVKAIGRSARPKSLAESDLRRSGLRSASNQLRETDQAVDSNKGKSKGKKNKKGARKTGAERSSRSVTPKSRSGTVSVNLGVKVDHDLSSAVRGDGSSSDDEEDVASTSTRSSGRVETELKSKKKKKRKKEEEGEEEEEEEETVTFRPKNTKSKWMNLVEVVAPKRKRKDEQEEDSDGEEDDEDDEDEDESESVVKVRGEDTAGGKKEEKTKKVNENDEEKDDDDNDAEADDGRRPKKKKETRLKKKKNSVAGKDDDDDDVAGDDIDDDQEEEEDDDDDAEKMTKRKKRKADIPASKPNKKKKLEQDDDKEKDEEEDESEEMPPQMKPEKEKKLKMKAPGTELDLDMVRQHMEEAIESVIAQSASIWEDRQGVDGGIQISKKDETLGDNSFKTSKVEDPESTKAAQKEKTGKKKKKRKEREDDDDDDNGAASRIATSSNKKKYTDSVIDYYFSEEESESEGAGARSTKKQNKVNNRAKKNKEKDSSEALGTSLDVTELRSVEEERCAEKDLEEKDLDSCNDVKAIETSDEKEHSKKDLSVSETITSSGATAEAFDETGDHPPDLKEESENGEPADDDNIVADKEKAGTGDAAAVEDTSLDHLIFNLMKVESVDPSEEIDSYAEWNIKVLTNEDLYKAVKFNDFSLVEAMMREAHQFDLEQVDPLSGLTLTMIATLNYSMEIVEMLVLNGANVNARAKDGHSALTMACDKGLHCAASLLLCLGANIGCQLPTGETALILAVKKNHYHVARVLLDHGVNIGASGVGERHALSLARQLSHQPIVELLMTHKTHLTSELLQQVSMALEGSAKLGNMVFPIQCFRLCDGNRFRVDFRHELQPTQTSRGMLLFLGHGRGSAPDMQVRLFGACAVTKAVLNNVALQSLNEDNFILTFCPLRDGHNQLEMYTVPLSRSTYKVHLIVAAFVVTLV